MKNFKKYLLADTLKEIDEQSETTFISAEEINTKKELKEILEKHSIKFPSPDLAFFRTKYLKIGEANRNGVILYKDAVEAGLETLASKQINFEHNGKNHICGHILEAKIEEDYVIIYGVFYKSLFDEEWDSFQDKFEEKHATVSFEIWSKDPITGESVVKPVNKEIRTISPIIFHGAGLLLEKEPACPTAIIDTLIAATTMENKIVDIKSSEEFVCASMIENLKELADIEAKEVKIETKTIEEKIWICPHCEKEIGEKEIYIDEQGNMYHKPCMLKGAIKLPKKAEKTGGEILDSIKKEDVENQVAEVNVENITEIKDNTEIVTEEKKENAEIESVKVETKEAEVEADTTPKEDEESTPKEVIAETEVTPVEAKTESVEADVKAELVEVVESKNVVKSYTEYHDVRVDEDGETKRKTFERYVEVWSDGTMTFNDKETESVEYFTKIQLDEAIATVKAELQKEIDAKDLELSSLKEEISKQKAEIEKASKKEEESNLIVGTKIIKDETYYEKQRKAIDELAFSKRK